MSTEETNSEGMHPEYATEGTVIEPQSSVETDESAQLEPQQELEPSADSWQASDTTDNDRLMAALAYASQVVIPILVPAVMLMAEESKARPFQKYHARQSLGFLGLAAAYEILAALVFCGLTAITGGCLGCVLWLIFFVPVVPALYYAYRAYQGLYFRIPFVTDMMIQNKWLEVPEK